MPSREKVLPFIPVTYTKDFYFKKILSFSFIINNKVSLNNSYF